MTKRALITVITGQDGAYLAEFLLQKGYEVHGIKRRASLINTARIDHLYSDPHEDRTSLVLHYGDMTDGSSLQRTIQSAQPDEIYNLAAQSHVAVSFEEPEYTAESDAVGTLRILEAIRNLGLEDRGRLREGFFADVWRGQALCLLDRRQLPGVLRHVRLQRHPVQPRVAASGRDVRHPQDHPRSGAHRLRP